MPVGNEANGLGPFLAASFFNGLVIELGRKLHQPQDEEPGVETYSVLWGKRRGLLVWHGCQVATAGFAIWAASRIGFGVPVAVALAGMGVVSLVIGHRYVASGLKGKWIEVMAGVWTLMLYAMLGVVPMLLS